MRDEIVTFDEILADPVYKAEFDRRVADALSAAQEKSGSETEESLKQQLDDLQTEIGNYKAQMAERDYSDAVACAIADKGIKFSSKAAEKAYLADLKTNRLTLKDGFLEGFDAYHEAQVKADPTAFQLGKPIPTFTKPVGAGGPPASESKGAMYAKQFNTQYAKTAGVPATTTKE